MIRRAFLHLYLQGSHLFASCAFFALTLVCVSLTLAFEEKGLKACAPAFVWILAILTTLFSTPLLLKEEARCGLLDEILLSPFSPALFLLVRICAESLLFGIPLMGVGLLFSLIVGLPQEEIGALFFTLLIGFPALSSLGVLGGLLTLQARGGGILVALLILPLSLPLLLLSLSGVEAVRWGLDSWSSFCLLSGASLLCLVLSVAAGSWALRFGGER